MSTEFINDQWRLPNAFNGTESNVNKQSNYSMDFDGNSQYIDIGNDISVSGNCTVSFWFKVPAIPNSSGEVMFARYTGSSDTDFLIIGIYLQGVLASNNSSIAGSKTTRANLTLSVDTWYHCAVTKISGVVTNIYINGTDKAGSVNIVEWWSGGSTNSGFIGQKANSNNLFNGQLDAVCIFDYALSSSQITTLYGSSSTGIGNPMSLSPKPVAYYPLGDQDAFNGSNYLVPNSSLKDYVFDFSSDSIQLSNVSSISNVTEFSISGWINSDSITGSDKEIFTTADSTSEAIVLNLFNGDIIASIGTTSQFNRYNSAVSVGQWYHIVMAYNGSESTNSDRIKLYKNGVLQSPSLTSGTIATTSPTITSNAFIGRWALANVAYFNGKISNFQIFNTALPATGSNSVETLYNNGSPLTSMSGFTSLVSWYKLDASEVYNSSTTEWEVNNALSPWTSSLSFGSNGTSHVALGLNSTLPTTAITLSLWVRSVDNSQNYKPIFLTKSSIGGQDASIYILAFSTGTVGIKIMTDAGFKQNFSVPAGLNDNKWHHISVTYDGTNIAYYTDGDLYTTELLSGTISYDTTTYPRPFIGANPSAGSSYFKGEVSNFQIFNSALPATGSNSVETLYNNGFPLPDMSGFTSLLNWYKLDNLTTGIEDSKGTQNGTNSGAVEAIGSVSTLNGTSSGMTQANLVASDLSFKTSISPFALNFDGTNDYIGTTTGSITGNDARSMSFWYKTTSSSAMIPFSIGNPTGAGVANSQFGYCINNGSPTQAAVFAIATNDVTPITGVPATNDGNWHHVIVSWSGSVLSLYIDGTEYATPQPSGNYNTTAGFKMGGWGNNDRRFNGSISNCSVWNAALTSAQVTEIYSEGIPQNLNNHSAVSSLVSWWQLGSNSSFNTNWTVLDEKGSNNGTSVNMGEDAIVDGVGSYANGLSSGMGGDEVIGDAPYSTANALSVNMDVEDRVTDTPS